MGTKKQVWAIAMAGLLLFTEVAAAHKTGHDIRTVVGCNQLDVGMQAMPGKAFKALFSPAKSQRQTMPPR